MMHRSSFFLTILCLFFLTNLEVSCFADFKLECILNRKTSLLECIGESIEGHLKSEKVTCDAEINFQGWSDLCANIELLAIGSMPEKVQTLYNDVNFSDDEVTYPLYPKNSTELIYHTNMVKLNEATFNLNMYSDKEDGRGVKIVHPNCFMKLRQLFRLVQGEEKVNVRLAGDVFEVKVIGVINVVV